MADHSTGAIETVQEDIGTSRPDIVRRWKTEIDIAQKALDSWKKKGKEVLARYRDEKERKTSQFNILWTNTEVLKPAVYNQTPQPDVRRRVTDPNAPDELARDVAICLERALAHSMDEGDFDEMIEQARDDYLLPGRGVVRERYIPTMGMGEPPKRFIDRIEEDLLPDGETKRPRFFVGDEEIPHENVTNPGQIFNGQGLADLHEDHAPFTMGEPQEEVLNEETRTEYVFWDDYLESPARSWKEVRWVSFTSRLTRDELNEQFPEVAKKVRLDWTPKGWDKIELPADFYKKATVHEIWNKEDRKVYVIAEGYEEGPLAIWDDPLNLEDFFPNPDPLDGVRTTDCRVPIPISQIYEDQAKELNRITQRINRIVEQLKVRGVYDASCDALEQLMEKGDGELIGVNVLAEKGGLDKMISFLPIDMLAAVLVHLYQQRDQIKQVIYEITGLSDIIRGATDPRETKGAQVIKAEFGNLRLQGPQKKVQRFVRDILRIKAEIIAEHFSAETLSMICGQPVTEQMMELLRNDGLRGFRIDIETDSTVQIDAGKDKQESVEMITATTGFVEHAGAIIQNAPETAPFLLSLLKLGLRSFKPGRLVEEQLDEMVAKLTEQSQQPRPDPEAAKAKAKADADMQKAQMDAQMQDKEIASREKIEVAKIQKDVTMKREEMVAQYGPSFIDMMKEAQQQAQAAQAQQMQMLAQATQALVQATQVIAQAAQTMAGPKQIVFEGEGRNRKPVAVVPMAQGGGMLQ